MGKFGVYALYLVFNYYNNKNTTLGIKNNNQEFICKGELQDQIYKGIDCGEEVPFLECCQENANKILNKSVEMNSCLNYSNYGNYSNMFLDCETNEQVLLEYFIVVGFSIVFTIIITYVFYRLYKKCFRNGYSYHYLSINEGFEREY